jgi:hypothetical protein
MNEESDNDSLEQTKPIGRQRFAAVQDRTKNLGRVLSRSAPS